MLSHELRTPLTPVLLGVETLMLDRDLQPKVIRGSAHADRAHPTNTVLSINTGNATSLALDAITGMMDTVRFSKIVETIGKPGVHVLWMDPRKIKFCKKPLRQTA